MGVADVTEVADVADVAGATAASGAGAGPANPAGGVHSSGSPGSAGAGGRACSAGAADAVASTAAACGAQSPTRAAPGPASGAGRCVRTAPPQRGLAASPGGPVVGKGSGGGASALLGPSSCGCRRRLIAPHTPCPGEALPGGTLPSTSASHRCSKAASSTACHRGVGRRWARSASVGGCGTRALGSTQSAGRGSTRGRAGGSGVSEGEGEGER